MWLGKRLFDLFFSLLGLIFLSPVLLVISLWIKLTSKGPVFFRQERVGLHRKVFRIHKFRTMYTDAERRGLQITVGTDSRITPVGQILRKYKIDELPQLIDVLIGDMSLVGPRPEVPRYVEKYPSDMKDKIFRMKPGITDSASIYFKDENTILGRALDPEKAYIEEVLPQKLAYAVTYLDKASLLEDFKIIFLTVFEIFHKREEV